MDLQICILKPIPDGFLVYIIDSMHIHHLNITSSHDESFKISYNGRDTYHVKQCKKTNENSLCYEVNINDIYLQFFCGNERQKFTILPQGIKEDMKSFNFTNSNISGILMYSDKDENLINITLNKALLYPSEKYKNQSHMNDSRTTMNDSNEIKNELWTAEAFVVLVFAVLVFAVLVFPVLVFVVLVFIVLVFAVLVFAVLVFAVLVFVVLVFAVPEFAVDQKGKYCGKTHKKFKKGRHASVRLTSGCPEQNPLVYSNNINDNSAEVGKDIEQSRSLIKDKILVQTSC